ncbi:hypothetical protein LINPERHAP1_LOCUS32165 [Linum perenne]
MGNLKCKGHVISSSSCGNSNVPADRGSYQGSHVNTQLHASATTVTSLSTMCTMHSLWEPTISPTQSLFTHLTTLHNGYLVGDLYCERQPLSQDCQVRARKKRKESVGEFETTKKDKRGRTYQSIKKSGQKQHCSVCNKKGHNKRVHGQVLSSFKFFE